MAKRKPMKQVKRFCHAVDSEGNKAVVYRIKEGNLIKGFRYTIKGQWDGRTYAEFPNHLIRVQRT